MGNSGAVLGKAAMDDTYFVQKVKLGQGTFGTVWRAKHRINGKTVAMKQLDKATLPRRGVTRKDIEREVSMMQACSHENITKLFDTFEDETSIWLALEYCDGGDFGDKVKEVGFAIQEPDVAEWMRQISAGLAHMHSKGICHRDIKPDNFMVAEDNTLKLTDFGLAVFLPQGQLLQDKCGTPAFMAPEQHQMPKRSQGYGFPVDMWAAGISMYMVMFGGRHPFLNSRGGLDDALLLNGTLDFSNSSSVAAKGLEFFGLGAALPLRFSEAARGFCKQMVLPHPGQRLTARDATRNPWLNIGKRPPARPSPRQERTPSPDASSPSGPSAPGRAPGGYPVAQGSPTHGGTGSAGLRMYGMPNGSSSAPVANMAAAEEAEVWRAQAIEDQNRKLQEERRQLQRELEQEKNQHQALQKQRTKEHMQTSQERSSASDIPGQAPAGRILPVGCRCKYEPSSSSQYGMLPAVVEGYNDSDGTYNLDVRQHAAPERIAPVSDASVREAWPKNVLVSYHSDSVKKWLPAVTKSFNDSDGTYNLDLREHADCDRMRLRRGTGFSSGSEPPSDPSVTAAAAGAGSRGLSGFRDPSATEAPRNGGLDRKVTAANLADLDLEAMAAAAGSVLGVGSANKVGPGDWGMVSETGLVQLLSLQNGVVGVEIGGQGGLPSQFKVEELRAPRESRFAWAPGTWVSYQSSSAGGLWIDATIDSFNSHNCTYNLDVRQEADPDKVRPRYRQEAHLLSGAALLL